MKNRVIPMIFAMLVFFLGNISLALAAIALDAPSSVGRGNAFAVRAVADTPVNEFIFSWLGKEHKVQAIQANRGWAGEILLPVPLDQKDASGKLTVRAQANAPVQAVVQFHEVKRPVQKLQVDRKYVEPPAAVQQRIKEDREKVRQALAQPNPGKMWQLPLHRPVQGTVSSQFGLKRVFNGQPRGQHRGLDLRGAQGTPIQACADGVVALVDDLYYSGNTVYVNHGDGVFTAYLHMSKTNVQPGQRVKRGDVLGLVGSTGRVTGPHLHLSLLTQGQSVDPLPLLEERSKGGNNAAR